MKLAAFLTGLSLPLLLAAKPPQLENGPNGHQLIVIPAGSHHVGWPDWPISPERTVKLPAFALARDETTVAQFDRFIAATHYVTDAERNGSGKVFILGSGEWVWKDVAGANWRFPNGPSQAPAAPSHPVTQISGSDAQAYCQWAGLRLPTLNEWEVAARAGGHTIYPWGPVFQPKMANIWNGLTHKKNTLTDGYFYTSPCGTYPANAWGFHDMIGNVFEYCADLPPGLVGSGRQKSRLISGRGGSWWCSFGTCSFFNARDIGTMFRRGSLANQGFRAASDGLHEGNSNL